MTLSCATPLCMTLSCTPTDCSTLSWHGMGGRGGGQRCSWPQRPQPAAPWGPRGSLGLQGSQGPHVVPWGPMGPHGSPHVPHVAPWAFVRATQRAGAPHFQKNSKDGGGGVPWPQGLHVGPLDHNAVWASGSQPLGPLGGWVAQNPIGGPIGTHRAPNGQALWPYGVLWAATGPMGP